MVIAGIMPGKTAFCLDGENCVGHFQSSKESEMAPSQGLKLIGVDWGGMVALVSGFGGQSQPPPLSTRRAERPEGVLDSDLDSC